MQVDDKFYGNIDVRRSEIEVLAGLRHSALKISYIPCIGGVGFQNFQQGLPHNACKTVVLNELSIFFADSEFL